MTLDNIVLIFTINLIALNGVDMIEKSCNVSLAHYNELGCKPIYSGESSCPEWFSCSRFTSRSSNKCYYNNQEYSIGDKLNDDDIYHDCFTGCYCRENSDRPPSLKCVEMKCPSLFKSNNLKCLRQFKLRQCCSYNEVCDPAEIDKLATCRWGTHEYKEGQRFYPENTCMKCVCTKEFDGTLNSQWCQEINCGEEIRFGDYINRKCAPVYYNKNDCCLIEWKCPDIHDVIVPSTSPKSSSNMKCLFGEQQLAIGDGVMGDDKHITCSCEVPPMVSCTRSRYCDTKT